MSFKKLHMYKYKNQDVNSKVYLYIGNDTFTYEHKGNLFKLDAKLVNPSNLIEVGPMVNYVNTPKPKTSIIWLDVFGLFITVYNFFVAGFNFGTGTVWLGVINLLAGLWMAYMVYSKLNRSVK